MKRMAVVASLTCGVVIVLVAYAIRRDQLTEVHAPAPIRLASVLGNPVKIKDVAPIYPRAARAARAHGTVMIEATITKTGVVENAHVIRSIPLLDEAALEAVKEWRFEPMRVEGSVTPVTVTLAVPFSLQ